MDGGDKEAIKQYIYEVFGTNGNKAIAIANCESGLNPNAKGDDYVINGLYSPSYGLFQIRYFNGARGTVEQLLDPVYNINKAFEMSKGGNNWSAWSCATKLGYQ